MANLKTKNDPIKNKFYDPIENAKVLSDILFFVSVVLSFTVLLVDKTVHTILYNFVQISFCLSVILILLLDITIRLYLKPRADDMRLKDFMSHAYKIPLLHDQSENYYNNNETIPRRKLAAQLLENSLHSKSTATSMAKEVRTTTLLYIVIWLILVFNRKTDMDVIAVATTALFGEQILSKFLRMEWTRIRYERVYDDVYNLFQLNPSIETFEVKALEALCKYETTKANGNIKLSSKIFTPNNEGISLEWETIKERLHIL